MNLHSSAANISAADTLSKDPPLADICSVLLEFFRGSAKSILQANNHPIHRASQEPPVETLASILADGVVLYEFLSRVDPVNRDPYSIQRLRRHTPSSPLPHGSDPNADALARVYKGNTRRLFNLLQQALNNVREYVNHPPPRKSAAMRAYVGPVEDVLPTIDPLPVTRLAMLVVAVSVYGPRSSEYLPYVLSLVPDLMTPFRQAMARAADAVSLPHPDKLLTASIRAPSGTSSPTGYMSPAPVPHHGYMSPSHYPTRSPGHATPPPGIFPHLFMSPPGAILYSLPASPLPINTPPVALSPRSQHPQVNRSRRSNSRQSIDNSPRPRDIGVGSSPGSAYRPPPSPARSRASESIASTDSRRRDRDRARPPRPENISAPLVSVNRPKNPDTFASPLPRAAPNTSQHSIISDDGMGGRKYSLVTDEGPGSRGSGSPPKLEGESKHGSSSFPPSASRVSQRSTKSEDVAEEMRRLEQEQRQQRRAGAKARSNSTTSISEEFYTPREDGFSPDEQTGSSRPGQASTDVRSRDMPQHQREIGRLKDSASPVYNQEALKNMVQQSVTTSVTQHISVSTISRRFESKPDASDDHHDSGAAASSSDAHTTVKNPKLFRGDSVASSVDVTNPMYEESPAPSDFPSPSRRWQVSSQKEVPENILSPETIFSPPTMPMRHSRSTSATQTSPRRAAPQLFAQHTESPHMSVSSAGGFSMIEQQSQQLKDQKVSFSEKISTSGGGERPLKPIEDEEEEETPRQSHASASESSKFSLPPSAGHSAEADADDDGEYLDSDHQEMEDESAGQSEDERSDLEQPDRDTEERDAEWNFPVESSSGLPVGDEESYNSEDENMEHDDDHYEFSGEEMPLSPDQPTSVDFPTASEQSAVDDEKDDTRMAKDQGQVTSPIQDTGSTTRSAANSETSRGRTGSSHREGYSRKKPPVPPGHSPVNIPYSSSTPTYQRRAPTSRDVPPTPPTPPPIETLLESIRPSTRSHSSYHKGSRPISTMAPSGELFQRLISIVQDAGDGDTNRDAQGFDNSEPASHQPGEGPLSHSSTHESTLPSGDTDADMEKVTGNMLNKRGQRPRAVRMASGPLAMAEKLISGAHDEKGETFEEHTSVASFSDAFSDEKERHWSYESQGMEGRTNEWEQAMQGDGEAGIPFSPPTNEDNDEERNVFSPEYNTQERAPRNVPDDPKLGAHSIYSNRGGVTNDGVRIKVDRRRLDWLTKEVLSARDAVSRKELQLTSNEMAHREQQEILLLEKQDAQCLVSSMKRVLTEREAELRQARNRLSAAIHDVSNQDVLSQTSRSPSIASTERLSKLITEGNEKLHNHITETETGTVKEFSSEMRSLFGEVQRAMLERMLEMTEKRDEELQVLRTELENRERLVREFQKSSEELRTQNKVYQEKAVEIRLEKEESAKNYELEMGHVTAQVELVNEFSKKLHDNFRETENLRRQVLHYQEKLSHITSASGISQRQIKELREAVTRANDECARLRREAEVAKRRGIEAVRRAEELEDLRYKESAIQSPRQFPDRQDRTDSGSLQSQPVRPPGQNRPGGMGVNARYHASSRSRNGSRSNTGPNAINAFLEKIFRKESGSPSRRRYGHGTSRHKDPSRAGSATQSSRSGARSRQSPRDAGRSRTHSVVSRTSNGSGSSLHSGSQRSGNSRTPENRGPVI